MTSRSLSVRSTVEAPRLFAPRKGTIWLLAAILSLILAASTRIKLPVLVPRAMGADDVEIAVSISDAFAIEFKRFLLGGFVNMPDRIARDDLSVLHRDELRFLEIVVNDATLAREALGGRAGNAADVFGFLPVLAEQPVLHPLTLPPGFIQF
ncbi:hypothetical protein [Bradyrhizobium sp. CSS354]|uniref:hypothetical protein n=1 Tax=Bradyrhizobium sp. CSS354 TaxID=2699172 RepID=UPI0023AF0817|nr:hypothetical protein [Bradyrhizobium sp. CSS354]MDE5465429.1 hypothetical protein [Bradyrhizobium sp. CSS354]